MTINCSGLFAYSRVISKKVLFLVIIAFVSCSRETQVDVVPEITIPKDTLITQKRANELFAKLSTKDPWVVTPDGSSLAWGESYVLEALVDLYEATADVSYLREVAMRGDRLISHRDDKRGVVDCSGKSRPAWSMGLKYVVAEGQLKNTAGTAVIKVVSTPSAYNNLTKLEVISSSAPDRFTLKASNDQFKRYETFSDLSLDPEDPRYAETIVNDPMSPYSAASGTYTEKSNLIRVKVLQANAPAVQVVTLKPVPLAFMGYIGVIYNPLLRFAEIVKANGKPADLVPAADRFVRAAEESYADASARLWRYGKSSSEGYYLTCEKGESFPADNVGAPFNYLAKHVCSELALYRLTGKAEYRQRPEKICTFMKNRLKYYAGVDLYTWYYWYEPMTTTGWSPADNLSANVNYFKPAPNVEDISHGMHDIAMIVQANRAGVVFTNMDVKRFANTLLVNVLTPDKLGNRRTVDGSGGNYPDYFNALHGWLELSDANEEVYQSIRRAYLSNRKETFQFCARLLKWEQRLSAKATRSAFVLKGADEGADVPK